jgi:chorismate mutase-like protein
MDISDWRKKIDELDRKLAALLNERAAAAVEIGRLKRNTSLPVYEPERERAVIENVQRSNNGPLAQRDLAQVYERIMDVMRSIQRHEIVPDSEPAARVPETDSKPDSKSDLKPKITGRAIERRKR